MAHDHPHATDTTRPLGAVLAITAAYAVAEVAGGLLANSLALLADAGHMLADISSLALALLAAWTARRPADPARTYGYRRVEILAALFNGLTLALIAVFIFVEAVTRLAHPPEVAHGLMGGVAAGGLAVNVVGALVLRRHAHGINVRAAYLHVLGDLLGSIGTLAAAGAIGIFGWRWADPVASVLIGVIIVYGAVRIVLDTVHVLLEGAPGHLRSEEVGACLRELEGVCEVHDLHLWSLGGDAPLLSAHLVLDGSLSSARVLRRATAMLRERFAIDHATLQLEPPDFNVIETLTSAERD